MLAVEESAKMLTERTQLESSADNDCAVWALLPADVAALGCNGEALVVEKVPVLASGAEVCSADLLAAVNPSASESSVSEASASNSSVSEVAAAGCNRCKACINRDPSQVMPGTHIGKI